jgi:predicted transcriptional regulator of viral defense system
MHALRDYASPRDKITALLAKGIIIRVKKGLYLFGQPHRRRPVSRETVANLVFGPSYISLEYALQFHGLIPEAVETITSVTTGRSRTFSTPIGRFGYRSIPLKAFRLGMDRVESAGGIAFLIATPEKALADKLVAERGLGATDVLTMRDYLLSSLRIPAPELGRLDPGQIEEFARAYGSQRLAVLAHLVKGQRRSRKGRQ